MPLILVKGNKGSGKNLLMSKLMIDNVYKSPIYSNYKLQHPNYRRLTLLGLLDIPEGSNVLMDEAYAWIESRTSGKYINIFASHLAFQLRKTKRNIFVSFQDESSIDKRYRSQIDYLITCKRVKGKYNSADMYDFRYKMLDYTTHTKKRMILPYDNAKLYFKYFDTYEIIDIPAKSRIEYELLKTEPEQFFKKGMEIYSKLSSSLNSKSTKEYIKLILLKNKYDDSWQNFIYILNKYNNINRVS